MHFKDVILIRTVGRAYAEQADVTTGPAAQGLRVQKEALKHHFTSSQSNLGFTNDFHLELII